MQPESFQIAVELPRFKGRRGHEVNRPRSLTITLPLPYLLVLQGWVVRSVTEIRTPRQRSYPMGVLLRRGGILA